MRFLRIALTIMAFLIITSGFCYGSLGQGIFVLPKSFWPKCLHNWAERPDHGDQDLERQSR